MIILDVFLGFNSNKGGLAVDFSIEILVKMKRSTSIRQYNLRSIQRM